MCALSREMCVRWHERHFRYYKCMLCAWIHRRHDCGGLLVKWNELRQSHEPIVFPLDVQNAVSATSVSWPGPLTPTRLIRFTPAVRQPLAKRNRFITYRQTNAYDAYVWVHLATQCDCHASAALGLLTRRVTATFAVITISMIAISLVTKKRFIRCVHLQ